MKSTDDLLRRIRSEYLEMPGLALTVDQVQRLCGVEPTVCAVVLETLTRERFLRLSGDYYILYGSPDVSRPRPARRQLRRTHERPAAAADRSSTDAA